MARRDPHSYCDSGQPMLNKLDWKISCDFDNKKVEGTACWKWDTPAKGPIDLDTRDLNIDKIVGRDGVEIKWTIFPEEDILGSRLEVMVPEGATEMTIYYSSSPSSSCLQWLDANKTSSGKYSYLFSQAQPIHARSMLPVQDSPRVRFSYSADVTVPDPINVVMSAAPGDKTEAGDGLSTFHFEMPQTIPAYLLALAAGEITSKDIAPRVRVYAEPALIDKAFYEFGGADEMLTVAEEMLGSYLWDRFDFIVMPPSFHLGGMENPRITFLTPTVLAGDRSLVDILVHELSHSWLGNLVTNASMNDFWLNEGFTRWAERCVLEKLYGEEYRVLAAAIGRRNLEAALDNFGRESPLTHLENDLSGVDPDEVFSEIPYEKGFLFATLMEKEMGAEAFNKFIRGYIEHFKFTSITTDEFKAYVNEKVPGLLEAIRADEWINGPGLPDNCPNFSSPVLDNVNRLIDGWKDGVRPDPEEAKNWKPSLWQIYLKGIPKTIDKKDCKWLDNTFGLSQSTNSEIVSNWFVIAANSAYEPAFDAIEKFVSSIGRMKLIKPIYMGLYKNESTKEFGYKLHTTYYDNYHPIAQTGLDSILPPAYSKRL